MLEMRSMDPSFPIRPQLAVEASPVVLIDLFLLDAADQQAFPAARTDDAHVMKAQPGFISTPLHRALGDSPADLDDAVWASTSEFRAKLANDPATAAASPHPFETVAVPGICHARGVART